MGNTFTSGKIKGDPAKVSGTIQMQTPCNKAAVVRFIGMVNYFFPFASTFQQLLNHYETSLKIVFYSAGQKLKMMHSPKQKRFISKSPTQFSVS